MKDATNYVEGKSKRKQKQQLSVDDAEKTGLDRTTLLVDGQAYFNSYDSFANTRIKKLFHVGI